MILPAVPADSPKWDLHFGWISAETSKRSYPWQSPCHLLTTKEASRKT